jgi:Pyruvate/2-oxoacid:ferredoxin oxidoreductase delta subunit
VSLTILAEPCIGCGACEFGCPTEAIHRPATSSASRAFWIETYLCNDCGWCPTACPVDCILTDPDTVICHQRGCPVAPTGRGPAAGFDCTEMASLCADCGEILWRQHETDPWQCPHCTIGMQVGCPKTAWLRKGRTGQRIPRRSAAELYELRNHA